MSTTIAKRNTKRNFQIAHNGTIYEMGLVIPSVAMKRAHIIVRDFLTAEWLRTCKNLETTARIMADGLQVGSVYGFHKDRAIRIIHH